MATPVLPRLAAPLGFFVVGVAAGSLWQQQQQKKKAGSTTTTAQPQLPPPPPEAPTNQNSPVDVFDAIGNTPLLELHSLSKQTGCKIYAKAEFMNPFGSIKDRAAKSLILDAEQNGQLTFGKPGGTIIEATGGNTGVSLAHLARARGYKTIITMPDSTSPAKIELMTLIGADVRVFPVTPLSDTENHFYHVAKRLSDQNENAVFVNQFDNLASMKSHYKSTGPEIWVQVQGPIHGFVSGCGTGGTIAGCSKFLKEQDPQIQVWLIDPLEISSLVSFVNNERKTSFIDATGMEMVPLTGHGTTIVEGVGLPRVTPNFHHAVIDKGVSASNQEVVDMAYGLLKNDGLFVGPSAAMNCVGAVKMAKELGPGHTIVTILCDGGEKYREKLYNPKWLQENNLTPTDSS